jgi:hypothetical protein
LTSTVHVRSTFPNRSHTGTLASTVSGTALAAWSVASRLLCSSINATPSPLVSEVENIVMLRGAWQNAGHGPAVNSYSNGQISIQIDQS